MPKGATKPKAGDKKPARDVSRGKEREDSQRGSTQEANEDEADGDYNLDRYLKDDRDLEAKEAVAVYDDKEPWDEPKKADKQREERQGSGQKSSLVAAYFGDKDKAEKKEQQVVAKDEAAIAKKYVSEKVEDLDKEIKRLKTDRDNLKAKERKVEEERKKLLKEREEFDALVKSEKAKLEELKEEELKKMKKEKKVAERNQKAVMNMPNRKEREEIDALKDKLTKITEENSAKEKKSKLTIERQKKQIEELLKRNKELEEEVYLLEQMRLKGGVEDKSKVPQKPIPKKSFTEDNYSKDYQPTKKKADDGRKDSSRADHKLKTKNSNLIEEQDELIDFQKAEDEVIEEMNASEHSEDRDDDIFRGKTNLVEEGSNKFQMNINPNEYAYSANKYYEEYIKAKSQSKKKLIRKTAQSYQPILRERKVGEAV